MIMDYLLKNLKLLFKFGLWILIMKGVVGNPAFAQDLDLDLDLLVAEIFPSSTRLPQSAADTPAGLTTITAQDIRDLGISKLPELMRLIPGMRMTQKNGWDYSMSFHGTNGFNAKRMSVMINGVAVYHAVFQRVDWTILPVDIKDIERVEVTRSPASATYGSNAFLMVVNIITRHPSDASPISASVEFGTGGDNLFFQVTGKNENINYLLSLSEQNDDGFDTIKLDDHAPSFIDNHNAQNVKRLNFRSSITLDEASSLNIFANGAMSDSQSAQIDPSQTGYGFTRQNETSVSAIYETQVNEKLKWQLKLNTAQTNYNQHWPTCYPAFYFMPTMRSLYQAYPTLAHQIFLGLRPTSIVPEELPLLSAALQEKDSLGSDANKPICGMGNNDLEETKNNAEFHNTYFANDEFTINTGFGYQTDDAYSETHFDGGAYSNYKYVFSNAEYRPIKHLTINAGFMWESASNVNKYETSPRLGFNFHINNEHTIRFIYSVGNRMPGLLETDRKWSYFMRDWDRTVFNKNEGWMFLTTYSPDELSSEKIESREIGLHGESVTHSINYDIRVFTETLSQLISEPAVYTSFVQTNNGLAELNGFEGEFKYKINSVLTFRGGYSYIDSEANNISEESLYSKSAGFGSIILRTRPITYALSYYGNSKQAGESYHRTDFTLSGRFSSVPIGDINWRISVNYYNFDVVAYQTPGDRRVLNGYNNDLSLKASIELSL